MEARGEEGDEGKENIIWKEDESEGGETAALCAWVSEDRREGSPRKLSAVEQK